MTFQFLLAFTGTTGRNVGRFGRGRSGISWLWQKSVPFSGRRGCSDSCVRSKFTALRQHFEQSPLGISAINQILFNRRGTQS